MSKEVSSKKTGNKKINSKKVFSENHQVLLEIVGKLRSQEVPDIDALVPMIEQATKSYKACKERLQSVKQALEEHLENEGAPENI